MAGKAKKTPAKKAAPKAKSEADAMNVIIAATMTLAADRPWREITLADIAAVAQMPLVELRKHISCKGDVLRELARRTDEALLASVEKEPLDGEAIDRLFEAVMRRLELLAPYKAAIGNILNDPAPAACECPPAIGRYFLSQRWMLAAAGLEKPGMEGVAKTMGLGMVYMRALRTWVEDDDPGLSHTMARLDRDLKRGERMLRQLEGPIAVAKAARRLGCALVRAAAGAFRPAPEESKEGKGEEVPAQPA